MRDTERIGTVYTPIPTATTNYKVKFLFLQDEHRGNCQFNCRKQCVK